MSIEASSSQTATISYDKYKEIDGAIQREDESYLETLAREPTSKVNLSEDPLTSVLIRCVKSQLAVKLVKKMTLEGLKAKNFEDDTALHVAAAEGDMRAARAILEQANANRERISEFVGARNEKNETPLHIAVIHGKADMFWMLADEYGSKVEARGDGGSSVLHYAIMCGWFVIPLEEEMHTRHEGDEEALKSPRPHQVDEDQQTVLTSPRKFPRHYDSCFDLLKLTYIPVFVRVEDLETLKKGHKQAMKLVAYLAAYPDYWDFIGKGQKAGVSKEGKTNSQQKIDSHSAGDVPPSIPGQDNTTSPKQEGKENVKNVEHSGASRWNESPLTLGAKMGLDEFVRTILDVCPESAKYVNPEGKNVLQVAIQNGHKNIVDIVESLTCKGNPILPSWLLSDRDDYTKNTILHFAAETTAKGGAATLQMQYELQWFEKVKKLVPKDLENSRNNKEMTAQELFTKNHVEMVEKSREQLMEMGKTCSSLLAAVVFASSFSIPQNGNDQDLHKRTAFRFFSHAFVIGLSCAATSLVLFLSLLTAPYGEQEFRRSLPTKYLFAVTSFFMALLCLLAAFSCNIYLSIYGGKAKLMLIAATSE